MRSWATMPVIWYDYNRPLTELPWWYGDYEPFASENHPHPAGMAAQRAA